MSAEGREPTEEEIRAALEEELKRVKVDQILLQTVVSLINLAGRRIGLAPGTEGERDLEQVRSSIDAVRALMPIIERGGEGTPDLAPIRDALSQLQMAYARESAGTPQPGEEPPKQPEPQAQEGEDKTPGPAQSSGRLWVPGQ